MDGSEKIVITQSKKTRCFKGIKRRLPVYYYTNGRSWMNSEVFAGILAEWDKQMKRKRLHILLYIKLTTVQLTISTSSSHTTDCAICNLILHQNSIH